MTQDEKRTKALFYGRVSSPKQRKAGDGIRSQETRCREFARMKGYEIVAVFSDDASGGTIERPGIKEALAYARNHRKDGIVFLIDDVSRLARGVEQHIQLRSAILAAGAVLESPSIEFGEDSDSILVENLLASVSQHQRQKNGEQTRNRMRARVVNGYWPFQAPTGFRHQRVTGRGMILTRDEPVASIVQRVLEGYAHGEFENQAEVMRFLQDEPLFPKSATGRVTNQRVAILLRNPVYAGYVEARKWGVSLREGQHEGLITLDVHRRILARLDGATYTPRRKNLNEDFPLRGHVACADCGTPLTACWSKGSHGRYPYYLCPKRGCDSYGKSIRRDRIEGEFESLLKELQPSENLFRIACGMLREWWNHIGEQTQSQSRSLGKRLTEIDRQIEQLLERVVEARTPSVIGAYEDRIAKLEEEKLVVRENMADAKRPKSSFDDTLRTALGFLANPWNQWVSGKLENRRTVLKLAFADRLCYARETGFRTANLSLPFRVLGALGDGENGMARPKRFELLTS